MEQLPQQDLLSLQLAQQRVELATSQAQLAQTLLDNLMLKIYLRHGIPVDASLDSATGKITLAPSKEAHQAKNIDDSLDNQLEQV